MSKVARCPNHWATSSSLPKFAKSGAPTSCASGSPRRNIANFDPSRDALPNDQLEEIDRWMLDRTAELSRKCREWYAAYDFHRVYHAIHDYCVVDLSSFYWDVLKDRLYTKAPRSI